MFIPAKLGWAIIGGLIASLVLCASAGLTSLSDSIKDTQMAMNCQTSSPQEAFGTVRQNNGASITIDYTIEVSDDFGKHSRTVTRTFTPCKESGITRDWPGTDYQVRLLFSGDYLTNIVWVGGP